MPELVLKAFVAYLLGSIIGSLVVGRFKGVDIRTQGSGNAGGTNALRTQGKGFAALVVLIDVGKGVLAATFVAAAVTPFGPAPWSGAAMALLCGAAAIVGHVWPLFYGFRGGKGAATYIGVLAVCSPWSLLPVLGVWVLSLISTGFVGLSTILATWALPAYALMRSGGAVDALVVFGFTMALFITWTHRTNVERMLAGNENRFEKAMLFRRLRG